MAPTLRPPLLAALALLAGCRLIDQRTFESTPAVPASSTMARTNLPPLPLLVVSPAILGSDWRAAVAQAVQAAEARKPGATFDVVTPVPTAASPSVQADFTRYGQEDGQLVARELQSDGVPPERISLRLQGDPGAPPREVRIYAR
jgi:nucleotide-binding universal stress UspA family protein